jgi:chromosome partitioning protein
MNKTPLTATTIAVINQKGGTGKTTTAVNLAAGLARAGRRVLLVDLDPQGHATYGLGIDFDALDADTPTVEGLFGDRRVPLERILMPTAEPNLTLLPADIRLAQAAAMLHVRNFRESILQKALTPVAGEYEYVILDCQPTLDVLAVNALVAANRVLIPTPLAGHALRGLSDLLSTIQSVKGEDAGFDWRILLTMVTGYGEERQLRAWRILEPLQDRILTTRVHRTEAIERSQMETDGEEQLTPVILQRQWNRGARDYRALVKEIESLWH